MLQSYRCTSIITTSVCCYLLKPFPFERFLQAVNKASDLLKLKNKELSNSTSPEKLTIDKEYILVKSEHKIHRISYNDIQYIQSMREYVAYFKNNSLESTSLILSRKLKPLYLKEIWYI